MDSEWKQRRGLMPKHLGFRENRSANLESTYDWEGEQWSLPINVTVSRLTRWGDQLVSLGGGLRYWVDGPEGGAEGLGVRLILTLLYPR